MASSASDADASSAGGASGLPGSSDRPAADLDYQTDVDQRRFQACGRFPGVLALVRDVRIDLHVVQTEGDQHLAVTLDGLNAPANQMLGFRGGDDGVEVPILRFIDRPGQCRATVQERNESPALG